MPKKKKVDPAVVRNNTCPHCAVVFNIPARWCPHCEDHHIDDDMYVRTGWCKRCQAGDNEKYLKKRLKRKPYVPIDPKDYGSSDIVDAYMKWVSSPEYNLRFVTVKELPPTPAVKAKMEDDEHQRWIDSHFPGL